MTEQEMLREKYEDALLFMLMEEHNRCEGERLLRENERLLRDPTAAVPKSLGKRCLRTIRIECNRRKRRKSNANKTDKSKANMSNVVNK